MKSCDNILSGPPFLEKWTFKSAAEYLLEKISKHGSSPALISMETGEELSHKEVLQKSIKLSISLKKMGLEPNDRIGICSENNLNYGLVILSSILSGITICPLNPFYTERELIHSLKISKPSYLFISIPNLSKIRKILQNLSWSPKLILLDSEASNPEPNLPDLISKIFDWELENYKLPEVDKKDHIFLIACSSGTTGFPKGVMLTDNNILSQIKSYEEEPVSFIKNADSFLGFLPLFHAYGFFIFILSLSFGNKLIMMSKFEERLFLKAIEKYRIKTLSLVPPIMVFLAKNSMVDEYDLSCVKQISCGAAPLSGKIREAVRRRFGLPFIRIGYGLTESTISLTTSLEAVKINSVGILRSGLRGCKIVSLDGNSKEALGPNCEGELCFKGDVIMKGYCGDEKATKAIIDEDGFLHTGDVGYYDEDGYFFIVDRIKELIKYKGFQVPPAELESILLTHPAIRDAAVVGLPDESAGELPLAFVAKQPGVEISAEEIVKFVDERVSPQKRLRGGVRFIEAIPKNPSGKILRRELRKIVKSKF